ncbi:MAG: NAD(+) kinase [Candidatus Cloacimonetes bacterium HGW-Cloacimonetes-3]|jgi:NAD+ kinase|nr:MAG: NAD(+) kinase [Candidatus Cloacimonetes bacterium HGW-Cloacimonetes-3]
MKNFAICINPDISDKQSIFSLLESLREGGEINFYSAIAGQALIPGIIKPLPQRNGRHPVCPNIDCILVFGGDGTILRAKQLALDTGAPILGINLGYLGFLSESVLPEIASSMQNLKLGKYKLLHRMLINCQLKRNGQVIFKGLALNDAVIYKANSPGLIHVRIKASGRYVFDTRCDGVVACTPTGSTAYSLSAGGPILAPQMKAIVLSPLNPHILSIRPMVFPSSERLMMKIHGLQQTAMLQIDGENSCPIMEGDEIHVTASERSVPFIKLSNRTFYQILRNKLHLGK